MTWRHVGRVWRCGCDWLSIWSRLEVTDNYFRIMVFFVFSISYGRLSRDLVSVISAKAFKHVAYDWSF